MRLIKSVVCLGGGFTQLPYIKKLKKLDYHIILIDKNSKSPGIKYSNQFLNYSIENYKKILNFIKLKKKQKNIIGVISPCTGNSYLTMNLIKKSLGKKIITKENIKILLDKKKQRKFLNKKKLSNIKIINVKKNLSRFLPLVIKPRLNGKGSKGVVFVKDSVALKKNKKKIYNQKKFLTEKFINGKEFALDVIWDGKKIVYFNCGLTIFNIKQNIIIGSTSHDAQEILDNEKELKKMIKLLCKRMNFGPEILNLDAKLDENGKIHIIEVEFVPADGVILGKLSFNYDIIKNYIFCHLGKKIDNQYRRKFNSMTLLDFKLNYKKNELKKINTYKNVPIKKKNKNLKIMRNYFSKSSKLIDSTIKKNSSLSFTRSF